MQGIANRINPAFEISCDPSERKTRIRFRNLRVRLYFPPDSTHLRRILGFLEDEVFPTQSISYALHMAYLLKQEGKPEKIFINKKLNDQLLYLLNRKPNSLGEGLEISQELRSPKVTNTFYGNQSLYVYSDIVEFCPVGDTVQQLLRTILIKAQTVFQIMREKFDQPHYIPVSRNFFENIHISIASDLGDLANFKSGKSLVKLHVRPVKF